MGVFFNHCFLPRAYKNVGACCPLHEPALGMLHAPPAFAMTMLYPPPCHALNDQNSNAPLRLSSSLTILHDVVGEY